METQAEVDELRRTQQLRADCVDRAIKFYNDSSDISPTDVVGTADAFFKFVTEGTVSSDPE